MRLKSGIGGGSLGVRLLAIALVPLIAVGASAVDQIDRQREAATASHELAEDVSLQQRIAAVIAPANLERIALEGLAQIDALRIEREIITGFTGVDFEALYSENLRAFDGAIGDLINDHGDVLLNDGTQLGQLLNQNMRGIRAQRQLSSEDSAQLDDISAAFEALDTTLTRTLADIEPLAGNSLTALHDIRQLDAIADVLVSAGDLSQTTVSGLIRNMDDRYVTVVSSSAVHQTYLDRFQAMLTGDTEQEFIELRSSVAPLSSQLFNDERGPDTEIAFTPDQIGEISRMLLGQIGYLDGLEDFSATFHEQILDRANARSDAAAASAQRTRLLVAAVTILALLITAVVSITTARPLLKLSRRAAEIGRGEINTTEPLPVRGPRLVRQLTRSMNEMLVTLNGVDEQISMMSTGDVDAAVDVELPGAIGVSMRQSVARLSSMTEQLAYQARTDALTSLPNRLAAMESLKQLLDSHTEFALLFIDIDGFKGVNDSHGHGAGDAVLREVGRRLSAASRSADFVARLGGDEFVVVVTELDHIDETITLGRRMIQEIEQPYSGQEGLFALSASIGVVASSAGMTPVDVLRQADNALYLAKQRGRGRVERYDATLQASIEHEADLALALRHGVRNDELVLYMQPIMDLTTGRMDHAEALVRWNRPGFGMVSPGEFIPIAERSSIIFEIERWVLTKACETLAYWRQNDPTCDISVAVNISGRHLIEGDLIGELDAIIDLTGADASLLEFELTETHLLEDLGLATSILNTLRSRGVTIAVDDFGTGYSSMNYLRDLPIDVIKIDRSFVSRSTEQGYDSTVIEAVITIADKLELVVVAEGIETQEQLEFVRAAGCHRAQGFLLARPAPIDAASKILLTPAAVA